MNSEQLSEGRVVVVNLDPLSHGEPATSMRVTYEVLKVTDLEIEIESPDGEDVVEVDAMAVVKVLGLVEILDEDGSVVVPDDGGEHGYMEIWYCVGGRWHSTEFGFPELYFLSDEEQALSPGQVLSQRFAIKESGRSK